MMRDCKIDSRLADFCLEHYQGKVISHYLDFTYEDKNGICWLLGSSERLKNGGKFKLIIE